MCECDGQVVVSSDCKEGHYCYRENGNPLSCGDGEIIDIDIRFSFSWSCVEDLGQCPGGGGFYIGDCGNSKVTVPPTTPSTTTTTEGPETTTTGGSETTTTGGGGPETTTTDGSETTTTDGSETTESTTTAAAAPTDNRSMATTVLLSSFAILFARLH